MALAAIRVNQVGYLPGRPMHATLVTEALRPQRFVVRAGDGVVASTGDSQPWSPRPDAVSGDAVHVLDFSGLTPAEGYRVEVGDLHSHPFDVSPRLYAPIAVDAAHFFRLMRCGDTVHTQGYARTAGHADDAVARLIGTDRRYDVRGGWYDAGDYGKYVVSGSLPVWHLVAIPGLADECRWQLDWLLRMQVPPGEPGEGLVFHRVHGREWSPLPGLPRDDPTERVVHPPTTAATLHFAAVAAHAARHTVADATFAAQLVAAAERAWCAAEREPVVLAPDDAGRHGGGPYVDADVSDDRYWAATELWLTTGASHYARAVQTSEWSRRPAFDPAGFDYDHVAAAARISLATARRIGIDELIGAADALIELRGAQPWGQPYAPHDGWAWGSNGRILANLVVLATAFELTGDGAYVDAVAGGMDYLLGRNPLDRCYVTGHGTRPVAHLRTRMWNHDLDPSLPPPPPGVLAGGANSQDTPGFPSDPRLAGLPPARRHLDEPTSETTNDCCIRWNALLVRVAAALDAWS